VFHIHQIDFHWYHFLVLLEESEFERVNENDFFSMELLLVPELNDVSGFDDSFYCYLHFYHWTYV
jgi:hypothetical protein